MAQEVAIHDEKAQAFLEKTLRQVKKVKDGDRGYISALTAVVFADIMAHFEREEGPDGKWEKWSRVYEEHMQEMGKGGNKILQDSGNLRQAFLPTNVKTTGEGILWYNPAKTRGGFPYAAAHDEGGPKLPQRQFMYLSDEAHERIESVTLGFLDGD